MEKTAAVLETIIDMISNTSDTATQIVFRVLGVLDFFLKIKMSSSA